MAKTILRIVLPEASDDNQLEVIFLNEDDSALFEESCRITPPNAPNRISVKLDRGSDAWRHLHCFRGQRTLSSLHIN